MVEEEKKGEGKEFKPSDKEEGILREVLGGDTVIVDKKFKVSNITLTKAEAEKRESLIEDVEYDFQLALNHGDYYVGKAVINFYLKTLPAAKELFI